jgi:hypothetical protein
MSAEMYLGTFCDVRKAKENFFRRWFRKLIICRWVRAKKVVRHEL